MMITNSKYKKPVHLPAFLERGKEMKNMIAVTVGYSFGIVPHDKCNDIRLKSKGIIKFNDSYYELYSGDTFEDSRKIDNLLDEYGEHSVTDYQDVSDIEVIDQAIQVAVHCDDGHIEYLTESELNIVSEFILSKNSFKYSMLSRMRSDCDYYLGTAKDVLKSYGSKTKKNRLKP